MSNTYLSVVIPAYNEEKRLPETLKKVRAYFGNRTSTSKVAVEVIVVNDGSTDETASVVTELIGNWPEAKLISYDQNRGKGYAVKTGMLAAQGQWRLLMDADGSTDISEVEKLLKFTCHSERSEESVADAASRTSREIPRQTRDDGRGDIYEIIIGSRYLDKKSIKIKQPLSRRIVSRLGNIIVRIVLGIKSVDTQCGFKLFSSEATEKIFPKQTIERWGFDVEILAIALKLGYKIKEVPVDWFDAEGSLVKKTAIFKTLKEIWQVKINLIKGRY